MFNFFKKKEKHEDDHEYSNGHSPKNNHENRNGHDNRENIKHQHNEEVFNKEVKEKEIVEATENLKPHFNYDIHVDHSLTEEIEKEIKQAVKKNLSPEELHKVIIEEVLKVVDNYKDFNSIQNTALNAARVIGVENIDLLSTYIKDKVSKPTWMKGRYEELGQWPMAVENSVLTIIYAFGKDGVDTLLKEAVKGTTASVKAMNLLCKLAGRGIERDKIVDSIIFIMKNLSEENKNRVLGYLSQVKGHGKVERLFELYFKKFILENSLDDAYDTVLDLINLRGEFNREQLIFIKALALFDSELDRTIVLKNEPGVIDFSQVSEETRTKAAITFYSMNKMDKEINDKLYYLKNNSLDLELREFLAETLE